MLKTINLSKKYFKGTVRVDALQDINLQIGQGDLVALMGASGCGKSTLLNLIGGLDRGSSGSILINGEDISGFDSRKLADFRREKVGFIFQQFNLIPTLTVLENVMLSLLPTKQSKEQITQLAKTAIARVGLEAREHHLPGELSGGEQQRVAIARALINNPAIILADEPTGDLDSKTGAKILELLDELNQKENRTIIIATHDPKITEITKRKIVMEDGKIIDDVRKEAIHHAV